MIRKQTAVWLFQETERVSSDRLIRVRAKQPHTESDDTLVSASLTENGNPIAAQYVAIGDLCVFEAGHAQAKIGKVLQLTIIDKGKPRPFKGNYVLLAGTCNYGVLCTWYVEKGNYQFKVCEKADFNYYHINNYVCTITKGCLLTNQSDHAPFGFQPSILDVDDSFTLTESCSNYIKHRITMLVQDQEVSLPKDDGNVSGNDVWVKIDKLTLCMKERNVITTGKKLTDIHISAAQKILHNEFPDINGLQNKLGQLKYPFSNISNSIQIVHVRNDHWAIVTTIGIVKKQEIVVRYYDSVYSTLSDDTEEALLQLYRPPRLNLFHMRVEIMKTPKQGGATDCGLHAIAIATALAHGIDPCQQIFRQEDMRSHFVDCVGKRKLELFPVQKKQRVTNNVSSTVKLYLCPTCEKPDYGDPMVGCDSCDNWFHDSCVPPYDTSHNWYCNRCRNKSK